MEINRCDTIFVLALETQINVIFDSFHTKRDKNTRIQKWKRLLYCLFFEEDRDSFNTIYSISLFDKIEIIVFSNSFHVKRRLFFENRVFNFENFKQLLLIMAADYRQRDYDDEEFLTFSTEILFLGFLCYQECKQEKFTRYAFYLVVCVLQDFRKKSQFNDYSYSMLNKWTKNNMEPFHNTESSDIESLELTQTPEESSGDSGDMETRNSKKSSEESDDETQNMEETFEDREDIEIQFPEEMSDGSEEVENERLEKSSVDSGNVETHSSKETSRDSREASVRCALESYLGRRSEIKNVTHVAQSSKLSEQVHVIRAGPKSPVHKKNNDQSWTGAELAGKIISQQEIQLNQTFPNEPSTSSRLLPPDRIARLPLHRLRSDPMHPKPDFRSHSDVRRKNVSRRQSFHNFCTNTAVPVNPSTSFNPPNWRANVPLHQLRSYLMHPKLDFQSHTDVWRQNRSQSLNNFDSTTIRTTDTYKDEEEKPLDLSSRNMNVSAKRESASRSDDSTRNSDSAIEKKEASLPKTSRDV